MFKRDRQHGTTKGRYLMRQAASNAPPMSDMGRKWRECDAEITRAFRSALWRWRKCDDYPDMMQEAAMLLWRKVVAWERQGRDWQSTVSGLAFYAACNARKAMFKQTARQAMYAGLHRKRRPWAGWRCKQRAPGMPATDAWESLLSWPWGCDPAENAVARIAFREWFDALSSMQRDFVDLLLSGMSPKRAGIRLYRNATRGKRIADYLQQSLLTAFDA
jgi:hypothetical protein